MMTFFKVDYLGGKFASVRLWACIVLSLVFFVNIAFVVWYIGVGYQQFFNSDAAVNNLLALEILKSGSYFPPYWNYVDSSLWVLGGHTFILPLLKIFPDGYGLHAFAGEVTAMLILLSTWLLAGVINKSRPYSILVVAIMAGGFSRVMAMIIYGEAAYGAIFYRQCFFLYFVWQFLHLRESPKRNFFQLGIILILVILFWESPIRALVTYIVPVFSAIAVYWLNNRNKSDEDQVIFNDGIKKLSGRIVVGCVAGSLLHYYFMARVINIPGASSARWLSLSEMWANLGHTLHGFIALFGGVPQPGSAVVSWSGIYSAGRFCSALLLLIMMPVSLYSFLRSRRSAEQFVAVFAAVSIILVLFIQITTTVPDMKDPVSSSRYLVPSLLLLLLIVIGSLFKSATTNSYKYLGWLVSFAFLTSAVSSFGWPHNGLLKCQPSYQMRLAEFLTSNGLEYGYATYWNAGAVTVLSDGKVRVRQINFAKGLPVPYRWLSANRWYRPSAWNGTTFMVLSENQTRSVDWQLMERYNGKPNKKIKFEETVIYIYNHNIADNLPGWDRTFAREHTFYVTAESNSQTGTFKRSDAEGPDRLVADVGESGCLHYGPYIRVNPGVYRVSFALSIGAVKPSAGNLEVGRIDVACSRGGEILAEKLLTAKSGKNQLLVKLDKCADLEFRVYVTGLARVEFKGASIVKVKSES